MDFSLGSLSGAFLSAEYQAARKDFLLFSFILATPADTGIFPNLLAHYAELHDLTSHYILVISPELLMNKAPEKPMNALEIADVLRTRSFYNHYREEYVDVSKEVERFMGRQTSEAMAFARFCGIAVDKLPCIVFFASLESPDSYIIWQLKNQDAASVIRDFRSIVSKIEEACNELIESYNTLENLKKAREELEGDIGSAKSDKQRQLKREIERIDRGIADINFGLLDQRARVPDVLDIVHSLDRERYVRQILTDLGKSVPILNLGLSAAKVF